MITLKLAWIAVLVLELSFSYLSVKLYIAQTKWLNYTEGDNILNSVIHTVQAAEAVWHLFLFITTTIDRHLHCPYCLV